MTRLAYLETLLDEIEKHPRSKLGGLIVSLDRRMSDEDMKECVDLTILLADRGRRVLGVDLCGDPLSRSVSEFVNHFKRIRERGL